MRYEAVLQNLRSKPRKWLVTGAAGFIGCNLVKVLLECNQYVVGLDNFATGYRENLQWALDAVQAKGRGRFDFVDGDVRDPDVCRRACCGVDFVLHQAALASVPASIDDPVAANETNVTGFLNVLLAAKDANVARVVYASSSAIYGNDLQLPKVEEKTGKPLSPYAATKYANEFYAESFAKVYGLKSVGLRYFNIFGPCQDPNGAYAAVIPRWVISILQGERVVINGDGETTRDFCYVDDAVQANILAATTESDIAHDVYNVGIGERISLNRLLATLRHVLASRTVAVEGAEPVYRDFRPGDVRHSMADISKIKLALGYRPRYSLEAGLEATVDSYLRVRRTQFAV